MSNQVATEVIIDGVLVTVVKLIGTLDSSDESYVIKLDPATLASVTTDGVVRASTIRIRRIFGKIEDGLTVTLWWDTDGTVGNAKRIEDLEGRFDQDYRDRYGSLPNNSLNGGTGKIGLSTEGWATGAKLSYALTLELAKYP